MMAGVTADLAEWGVPKADIRMEAFGPASIKKTEAAPPPAADAPTLAVEFAHSGKTVNWSGADSLLELAEAHDIVIDSGCRAGNCGDGSVEHCGTRPITRGVRTAESVPAVAPPKR